MAGPKQSEGRGRRARFRIRHVLLLALCIGAGGLAFAVANRLISTPKPPAQASQNAGQVRAESNASNITSHAKSADFWRKSNGGERIDMTGLEGEKTAPAMRRGIPANDPFYGGLLALQDSAAPETVTVLHLGDSHIASDHITGELRRLLQARFGNAGRGLMMPGFPFPYYKVPGFRFEKTGDWTVLNSLTEKGVYGVTGVSLSASAADATLNLVKDGAPFASAEIEFLTGPGHGSAIVSEGKTQKRVATAAASDGILRVRLGRGHDFTIAPKGDGKITVLGWSTDSGKRGVRYINLGIPSASVLTTARWDPALVTKDIEHLSPQLVVLGYGTNGGFQDGLDLKAYKARYLKLVKLIQAAAPKADFLILGPLDGAKLPKYARFDKDQDLPCRPLSSGERLHYDDFIADHSDALDRWYEPPKLDAVRDILASVATQIHADYIDLSAVMGGPCSIAAWASADPPLALPDHVHLTERGYRRIGDAIFAHLMKTYAKQRDRLVAEAKRSSPETTGSITTEGAGDAPPTQ